MSEQTKLDQLNRLGQSIWLDNINRSLFTSGVLKGMIDQGLRGMTSNPTIFEKAIANSNNYDEHIQQLVTDDLDAFEMYDELTIKDVQTAADHFKGVYEESKGLDGYVSLEINPKLANKDEEQFVEGLRLFKKLERPNVMIKVPATPEGVEVVRKLLSEGVNVNVTLIFSQQQYEAVADAYIKGIQAFADKGGDASRVHSVASVFVSRVDVAVEKIILEKLELIDDEGFKKQLKSLIGQVAIANGECIFDRFNDIFSALEFKALVKKGANQQRVLWASTGTKKPEDSPVKYIESLIANPTVNTLPTNSIEALHEHAVIKINMPGDVAAAKQVMATLQQAGIDLQKICNDLQDAGARQFVDSFEQLLQAVEDKAKTFV